MTVVLWCCDDSKVGGSLGLQLLPEGILHCVKRDTRVMQDRNSRMLVEAFPGRDRGIIVTVDCPSNLHSKEKGWWDFWSSWRYNSLTLCNCLTAVRTRRSDCGTTSQCVGPQLCIHRTTNKGDVL